MLQMVAHAIGFGLLAVQQPARLAAAPVEVAIVTAFLANETGRAWPRHDTVWVARRLGGHEKADFQLSSVPPMPVFPPVPPELGIRYNALLDSATYLRRRPALRAPSALLEPFTLSTPPRSGLHLFTRPAVSDGGDSAIIGHMFLCPGLCGSTEVLVLRRKDSRWVVAGTLQRVFY